MRHALGHVTAEEVLHRDVALPRPIRDRHKHVSNYCTNSAVDVKLKIVGRHVATRMWGRATAGGVDPSLAGPYGRIPFVLPVAGLVNRVGAQLLAR
ncbi:hypothetical protein GCM10020218_000960 [Dactylosporangium vinaceum]